MRMRDRWVSGVFLFGVTVALWVQPSTTYSWVWNEAKDAGHEFAIGLLDISHSHFADNWKVVEGGNQAIDLSNMIPGDARKLEATLSKGNSDLDFVYRIVAEVKEGEKPGSAEKLAKVLRVRIENKDELIFDGPVHQLTLQNNGPKDQQSHATEALLTKSDPNKDFVITVYLPEKGLDASYQGLSADLVIRFLAKQATPGAIYGG
ncbi:hypothetical protein [Brevibacillus sp. SYSU BS000544]|uniref:hypothetical protein n=1 Tax=Brevibacillus sp. SYSU BS000544 TaxID=3416443 RepID=UPI003CE4D5E1